MCSLCFQLTIAALCSWLSDVAELHCLSATQVKQVVPDQLLLQLLCSWLGPQKPAPLQTIIDSQQRACNHPDCCKVKLGLTTAECADQICSAAVQAAAAVTHPPLHGIAHFHAAIRSTLERFVTEVRNLSGSPSLSPVLVPVLRTPATCWTEKPVARADSIRTAAAQGLPVHCSRR